MNITERELVEQMRQARANGRSDWRGIALVLGAILIPLAFVLGYTQGVNHEDQQQIEASK